MRAIRAHEFGGPEVLRLDEVADPAPAPGELVVRLHAAGVNPVDTYVRSGVHKALFDRLERAELKPVISRGFALADAAEAHKVLTAGGSGPGKIVLEISE